MFTWPLELQSQSNDKNLQSLSKDKNQVQGASIQGGPRYVDEKVDIRQEGQAIECFL
jgi:hypothetical protein